MDLNTPKLTPARPRKQPFKPLLSGYMG